MSLPVVLRAAQHYLQAETRRLTLPAHRAETVPDFSALQGVTHNDGAEHLAIDPRHQPRAFDPAVAYFLKISEALGSNLLLNCRRARQPGAMGRLYVRMDSGETHVYVNRIIMDAQPGEVVRERGTNFRSHLPEDLRVDEAPLRDGPGKHIAGRQDAIDAILRLHDAAPEEARAAISRANLERLFRDLINLADQRASDREALRKAAS